MIRIAGNTQIPTLWVIEKKQGYKTYCHDDGNSLEWLAEKGDIRFSADSPEELLGLIFMYNELGDHWREAGNMEFLDDIMSREDPDWSR